MKCPSCGHVFTVKRVRTDPVLQKIFDKKNRGMATEIAAACGISRQAVQSWAKVPEQYVKTVARIMKKKPRQIRPDLH